jgi:hypothetical protein
VCGHTRFASEPEDDWLLYNDQMITTAELIRLSQTINMALEKLAVH